MRDDQTQRLDDLTESLMDTFLEAADPKGWTGAGQPADKMDPATRGARNWDCKNANQIGALAARAMDLRDRLKGVNQAGAGEASDDAAEADISRFEKAARDALKKAGIVSSGKG